MEKETAFRASVVFLALAFGAGVAGAQNIDRPQRVDTTVSLERNATLSVSIHAGRVNVTGVPGSSAHIKGSIERGVLDIRSRASGVTIDTDPEGPLAGRVDLDITVPIGTSVVLEAVSAPFTVRGVKGEVQTENVNGDVDVADAVGRVDAETVSGDVTVTQVKGDVRVEGVNGTVTVSNVDGDVGAETVSGGIALSRVGSKSVRAETVAGRIGFNGKFDPAGSYSFKSHAGALTIGVPANTGATVSLETFNGSVESDFPVTLESGHGRRGHESRMEFRIGDGRSRIVLETFSGSIKIQRSTNRDDQE